VVPHPSRPPESVHVRTITIEHRGELPLSEVLTKQEWAAYTRTMYKRKDRKINPVNTPLPNGVNPGGAANFDTLHDSPKQRKVGKIVPRGSRLTPERLEKMNIGGENKQITKILFEDYKVRQITVSAYHPQSNGLVERGHDAIVNSISKYCSKQPDKWVDYLPLALWADRISIRRTTGYSAFELLYGRDCLLPIDITLESWSVVDWEGEVTDRESLLIARMRQLDQRNLREAQASTNLENSRKANKAYFDSTKRLRSQPLQVGDLVLLHNSILQHSHSRKLDDKWRGPYRIREISDNSTFYHLEELDGTPLAATFAGNRLKKFFSRAELDAQRTEQHETIRVRDLDDVEDVEETEDGIGRENMETVENGGD
jgi:hypothetical protein